LDFRNEAGRVSSNCGRRFQWQNSDLVSQSTTRSNPKFPTVGDAVNQLKLRSTILDGEIVALDKDGIPRFQLLQQWQKRPTAPVVFYLFDLLWHDGRDITGKTVLQRRDRLQQIITPVAGIQVGGYIDNHGKDLFHLAKKKVSKE